MTPNNAGRAVAERVRAAIAASRVSATTVERATHLTGDDLNSHELTAVDLVLLGGLLRVRADQFVKEIA